MEGVEGMKFRVFYGDPVHGDACGSCARIVTWQPDPGQRVLEDAVFASE